LRGEANATPSLAIATTRRRCEDAGTSDFPAGFRAYAASIAACAKVLRRMTAAFLCALMADPRAQRAKFEREMALPG